MLWGGRVPRLLNVHREVVVFGRIAGSVMRSPVPVSLSELHYSGLRHNNYQLHVKALLTCAKGLKSKLYEEIFDLTHYRINPRFPERKQ